jgi:hypothetical protein
MRLALDTKVLAYAEGMNGASKKNSALDIIASCRKAAPSCGPSAGIALPRTGPQSGPLGATGPGRDLELASLQLVIQAVPVDPAAPAYAPLKPKLHPRHSRRT